MKKIEEELRRRVNDPVLSMLGVGHQLWEREPGDEFVERLRRELGDVAPPLFTSLPCRHPKENG